MKKLFWERTNGQVRAAWSWWIKLAPVEAAALVKLGVQLYVTRPCPIRVAYKIGDYTWSVFAADYYHRSELRLQRKKLR